jgi:hypothetical protein
MYCQELLEQMVQLAEEDNPKVVSDVWYVTIVIIHCCCDTETRKKC